MKAYILMILLFTMSAVAGNVKIIDLPLGTAASTTSNDVYPYVDAATGVTKKMTIWDIVNIPAFTTSYVPTSVLTTKGDMIYASAANTASRLPKGTQYQVLTGGAVTPTYGQVSLDQATAVTGILPVANGGSNKALTLAAGGLLWTDADSFEVTAAGTTGQILRSTGTTAPAWSTATYPATTVSQQLLYSTSTNVVGGLSATNGGLLNYSSIGVPSATVTPVLGVAGTSTGTLGLSGVTSGVVTIQPQAIAGTYNWNLPITAGSSGQHLVSGGGGSTPMAWSTATFPSTATGTGTILRADGTNWVATTATYPATTVTQQLLYSTGTNVVGGLSAVAGGLLNYSGVGVPSSTVTPVLGLAGTSTGTLGLSGVTSGVVTIQPVSAAGTYNFNLPITAGSAGQALTSQAGGSTAMTWTTVVPNPGCTAGQIYTGATPSCTTATYPSTATGTGKFLKADGTNWIASTATLPDTATGTGTILRADGTNWVATTATYPSTTTINRILYSSSGDVVGQITTANTGALVTSSSGVPSIAAGSAGTYLQSDGTTVSFGTPGVTSRNSSATTYNTEIVERAKIRCYSGSSPTAGITSQSGAWVSSMTNVASGCCTLTIATGIFSAAPTCTANIESGSVGNFVVTATQVSATSHTFCFSNAGAAFTDVSGYIMCMGPR